MRASSLSNSQILDLLTRYFVPVLYSVDDYDQVKKDKLESAEWDRIRARAHDHGFAKGSVCVYLVEPGGDVLASMIVDQAMKPENLIPMLNRTIERQKMHPRNLTTARSNAAPARSTSAAKIRARKVHIWTRNLGPDSALGLAEDRVELTPQEWKAFLPKSPVRAGMSWTLPSELTDKLYPYFFPPIKNYDAGNSVIRQASLTAVASDVSPRETRLLLRGTLLMDHPLRALEKPLTPGEKTNGRVNATVRGAAVFDSGKQAVRSFQMVTQDAEYVWHWQGNPVRTKFMLAAELDP